MTCWKDPQAGAIEPMQNPVWNALGLNPEI